MSAVSTTFGGVTVVTHVSSHGDNSSPQPPKQTTKFSLSSPLALGTVQIMIGLVVLLFGISVAVNASTMGVYSGIFVWGAGLYITAGSLTVAAGKTFNRCLVNGSLGVSMAAVLVAITGFILCLLDAIIMYPCYDYDCRYNESRVSWISGCLALFHLLMLVVSAVVAGFACNATCKCNAEPVCSVARSAEQRPSVGSLPISVVGNSDEDKSAAPPAYA